MADFRIVARNAGGAEVLTKEPLEIAPPLAGEARVRQTAIGVNYVDTYHRSGLYPGSFPAPLGGEAAGVIEELGPGVDGLKVGDRVAYGTGGQGAYATVRNMAADHLVRLPETISDEVAASSLLKGMTAAYLVGPCSKITAGQSALVHSAAGGVGSILVQWLKILGVKVIAHVSSAEKAADAVKAGADVDLWCSYDVLADAVHSNTDGRGVDVVFDGVGQASWQASLDATAPCGLLISYGNASGPVQPFTALDIMRAGSIFVTRPTLRDYGKTRAEREALVQALFEHLASGRITVQIGQRFALSDAQSAHRALEARQTRGSTVLLPD